ncbi:MAG: LPS export ABC transporter periplasmic protein LptC, partial [Lysobacterales bacterium]
GITRIFDPECLACHVTGWHPQQVLRYKTGFINDQFATDPADKQRSKLLQGQQFPNNNLVRLSMVQVSYPGNERNQGWELSANEGEIMGDGHKIVLRDNVQAHEKGENAMRLIRTSELVFDPVNSIASTDADVIVELDGYRLTATGMTANLQTNTVKLQSAVNAHFEP